ncbi:MAG: hypothetical protein IJT32_02135 [Lachnospiraceae bacterium]|nr:hypothetical protein [Lachnospiraceae bacterium]
MRIFPIKNCVVMFAAVLLFVGCMTGCADDGHNKSDGALLMSQTNDSQDADDGEEAAEDDEAKEEEADGRDADGTDAGQDEDAYRKKAEELLSEGNLYILTDLDTEAEQLTLKSIPNGKRLRYRYTLGTRFLNKYNEVQSESNFVPGVVVSIEKNAENVLETVTMNGDVWVVENLKNYSIDEDRGIFTIGQTRYRLSDLTEVFANGGEASIGDIRESDILRVVGWEKDILSVSVTTGHGYLALVNTILFDDSIISIGGKIHMRVTANTTVELTEGEYVVTAAKDGYGGQATVEIKSNEQTVLDMAQLKGDGPKKCKIRFVIEAEGARVFIDHEEVPVENEVEVTYGQHRLKVIADGYEPWEKALVVNSPTAQLELSLVSNGQAQKKAEYSGNSQAGGTSGADAASNTNAADSGSSEGSSAESSTSSSGASSSEASGTNAAAGSSASTATSGTTEEERRNAEIDYLTTLSNMISTLTGN